MGVFNKSNHMYKKVSDSLLKNELSFLLLGTDQYFCKSRDGQNHDYMAVLHKGIYEYYNKKDKTIRHIFEKALLSLMNGSDYEFLVSFDYIWKQKLSELSETAPFSIDESLLEILNEKVVAKENSLKQYKDKWEFGAALPDGAWEYIHNINNYFQKEYGYLFLKQLF